MERDLNVKKLIKMYILNIWFVILVGIAVAVGLSVIVKEDEESVISKSVYLVYDLEQMESENFEARKYTYFDVYKGLLSGNILKSSDLFTDDEKNRLSNTSLSVESSCYTITLTVPSDGQLENDEKILDKYIAESEVWMREKFGDDNLCVETLSDNATVEKSGTSFGMIITVGFVIGVVLAAMILFVWFVLDKKIRTEEDVVYYTGVECIGTVKSPAVRCQVK